MSWRNLLSKLERTSSANGRNARPDGQSCRWDLSIPHFAATFVFEFVLYLDLYPSIRHLLLCLLIFVFVFVSPFRYIFRFWWWRASCCCVRICDTKTCDQCVFCVFPPILEKQETDDTLLRPKYCQEARLPIWSENIQSQKKRKLSGQQDICRLNFPDKARKSRQFSNSRQMSVKGVHARS